MSLGVTRKRFLTKSRIVLYFVILPLLIFYMKGYFISGWLTEQKLEADCSDKTPSDTCLVRMRAMGNFWSTKGNLDRAERWYQIGADHNDEIAMFHLGWIHYMNALMVTRSWTGDQTESKRAFASRMENASQWYIRSSDKGFAPAMNNLGQLYLQGNGKVQDEAEALKWTLAAAKVGNPVAAWNLAVSGGRTPLLSPDEAKEWLVWDSRKVDRRDLLFPILDRTMFVGSELPEREKSAVRAAAQQGTPVKLELSPLKPSPLISTFHHVDEEGNNDKGVLP